MEEGALQASLQNGTGQGVGDPVSAAPPLNDQRSDQVSGASSVPHSPDTVSLTPDLQVTPENLNIPITTSWVIQTPPEQHPSVCHVSVPDPAKLELLALSDLPDKLKQSHPAYEITVTQNGLEVKGPVLDEAEKLKSKLLEFLNGVSQLHDSVSTLKADFLQRQDVRDKLTDRLKALRLPCRYTVTGGVLIVCATSMQTVRQACQVIKSEVSEFILPLEPEHQGVIFSEEWRNFILSLDACSASTEGISISVVTLKDTEQEVKENILRFLSTPIQKEMVLSMQPAMLTYIQLHHQQLLMDMAEVLIFPLDTGDGLIVSHHPARSALSNNYIYTA